MYCAQRNTVCGRTGRIRGKLYSVVLFEATYRRTVFFGEKLFPLERDQPYELLGAGKGSFDCCVWRTNGCISGRSGGAHRQRIWKGDFQRKWSGS